MKHILVTLSIFTLTILPNLQSQAQCHIDDWTALKALYDSTNGDNWTNRNGWDVMIDGQISPPANCDLGNLYGIHSNGGRVWCIDLDGSDNCGYGGMLRGNGLSGVFPNSIYLLSFMQSLNLSGNNITGNIPTEIENLINLISLNLSDNDLSGDIPTELYNLLNLQSLNLEDNNFEGQISPDLNNLTALTHLNLSYSELVGNVPSEICSLPNLSSLNLSHNQLVGVIPSEIGNLVNLTDLMLENNSLNGSIPSQLSNLTSLRYLHLDKNQLSGSIPSQLGNLTSLIQLDLSFNQISGSIPTQLGNLSNLSWLFLSMNEISGNIPSELGYLSNLNWLYLSNNQISGQIPSELSNLTSLNRLMLGSNQLNGNIPIELCNLSNLNWLSIGDNKLSGNIPDELENLTNLIFIFLSSNQLSGAIPPQLGNLTNLEYLDLEGNQLSGSIPPELGNLSNLNWLSLHYNQLRGSIPPELGELTNLEILNLASNELSGNIPSQLGNLTQLTILSLEENQFNGNIPPSLGNLSNLNWLSLHSNQLSGSIPPEIDNLQKLTILSLHSNKLTGTIPQFTNLSIDLTLSNNFFTCEDIEANLAQNQQLVWFGYSPQNKTPQNYDSIKSNVIYTNDIGQVSITISPNFGGDTSGFSYQWVQNNTFGQVVDNADLVLQNLNAADAGKYTLYIQDQNCSLDVYFISDPIYVIVEGYDLYGQPVEYNEIMVEFDSPPTTQFYEDELLYPNAGWVTDVCNCNRELYLWKFNNADDAMAALLEIDLKKQTIKGQDSDIDGGFNNYINVGSTDNGGVAYDVLCNMTGNYPDDVSIYLLDTGLDETGITNTPYLMQGAPVDNCYTVNPAPGYNYTTTILNNDYIDEHGHGTYGFRSITDELSQQPNNIDVVPLKIFNENGEGSLFDLTCAVYHALDHGADVINISAGYRGQPSSILEKAINIARENGVFICTAAGNDALDIDVTPQYPAYFASQYHYEYDDYDNITDSTRYANVISISAIDAQNNLVEFSNYGQEAVTMSAYGENIHSYGLAGSDEIWSGTSMATYYVSRELALEIASNKNRAYQQIWSAFETNSLTFNVATVGKTRTAKQLDVSLQNYVPPCTGCNCNNRMSSKVIAINNKFGHFANDEFVNNYITAEKSYINHRSEIHNILSSKDARYNEVQQSFKMVKDFALTMLFQSFVGKGNTEMINEHIELIDGFLVSLSKVTKSKKLKSSMENTRKYLYIMEGKEVKDALIAFDRAEAKETQESLSFSSLESTNFEARLINSIGSDSYIVYNLIRAGSLNIELYNISGQKITTLYNGIGSEGNYQLVLNKSQLSQGVYFIHINYAVDGALIHKILKLPVVQ